MANPDDMARAERAALHQPLRDLPVGDGPVAVMALAIQEGDAVRRSALSWSSRRLKAQLNDHLTSLGHEVIGLGPDTPGSVDYPDSAGKLAAAINEKQAGQGVLMCGSGIGISIAANRHRHLRAAVCHDGLSAQSSRQHDDAHVLVLGARLVGSEVAKDCATILFSTAFEGGRHQHRVNILC